MNDPDYRALIERAHQIRELTQQPGWSVLVEEIAGEADEWQKRLLGGHAKSVEEYRGWAGRAQGLKAFLDLPDRLDQRVAAETKRRKEEAEAA